MLIAILFLFQLALFLVSILGPWRGPPERKTNGRLPLWARMLLSFSLLVAAFVIWQSGPKGSVDIGVSVINFGTRTLFYSGGFKIWLPSGKYAIYAQWVMLGMLASFIGDLIMARLIPLPNRLIGGMAAFGIAHALYITAYIQTILASGAALVNVGLLVGLLVYDLIAIFGWWFLIRNPQKEAAINIGALVYGLWISVMASFALALATALGGAFWLTALGGLLFVSSDFIIGVTDIRGVQIKNANDWIWLTYVAAQMGIIYAGWIGG